MVSPDPIAETRIAAMNRQPTGPQKDIESRAFIRANLSERVDDCDLANPQHQYRNPAPPRMPTTTPSIAKGQRMNQRVAPTRRMTSISRRRV